MEPIEFAKKIAYASGKMMQEGIASAKAELKPDASYVTQVDQQINSYVISELRKEFPDHGLFGEEESSGSGDDAEYWICDPIDGTKVFLLGVPLSVFMLSFVRNKTIQLSVVHNPWSNEMLWGIRGRGVCLNEATVKVSNESLQGGFVVGSHDIESLKPGLIAAGAQIVVLTGTGYRNSLVVSGKAVASVKFGGKPWDVLPTAFLVEEAGGRVTDFSGKELSLTEESEGVIMSNGFVHDQLLKICSS